MRSSFWVSVALGSAMLLTHAFVRFESWYDLSAATRLESEASALATRGQFTLAHALLSTALRLRESRLRSDDSEVARTSDKLEALAQLADHRAEVETSSQFEQALQHLRLAHADLQSALVENAREFVKLEAALARCSKKSCGR